MGNIIQNILGKLGYALVNLKKDSYQKSADIKDVEFWELYNLCKPYTMTSLERMYGLYSAVKNVLDQNIAGDFVECGVWRGGSAMLMAFMLQRRGIKDRKLFLYDTFEGMSEPTQHDVDVKGRNAKVMMQQNESNKETSVWCLADLTDVRQNMALTQLPEVQICYIKGKVEETIPAQIPSGPIALLRLDTDWYESTRHELRELYPLLSLNGILIIDDYGHWEGCRKAVDEYFESNQVNILLHRVDYTGRVGIKTHA